MFLAAKLRHRYYRLFKHLLQSRYTRFFILNAIEYTRFCSLFVIERQTMWSKIATFALRLQTNPKHYA